MVKNDLKWFKMSWIDLERLKMTWMIYIDQFDLSSLM